MEKLQEMPVAHKGGLEKVKHVLLHSISKCKSPTPSFSTSRPSIESTNSTTSHESCGSCQSNYSLIKHIASGSQSIHRKFESTSYEPSAEKVVQQKHGFENDSALTWTGHTYLNGSTYEGTTNGGLYDGLGVLLTPSFIYAGEWHKGMQHGIGVLISSLGSCNYEGVFVEGKAHGYGREIVMDLHGSSFFYGRFVNGRFKPSRADCLHQREAAVEAAANARRMAALALSCLSDGVKEKLEKTVGERAAAVGAGKVAAQRNKEPPLVNPGPLSTLMQVLV